MLGPANHNDGLQWKSFIIDCSQTRRQSKARPIDQDREVKFIQVATRSYTRRQPKLCPNTESHRRSKTCVRTERKCCAKQKCVSKISCRSLVECIDLLVHRLCFDSEVKTSRDTTIRGRGRGGRGDRGKSDRGGRGGRGGGKNSLVQTSGLFSEGTGETHLRKSSASEWL